MTETGDRWTHICKWKAFLSIKGAVRPKTERFRCVDSLGAAEVQPAGLCVLMFMCSALALCTVCHLRSVTLNLHNTTWCYFKSN